MLNGGRRPTSRLCIGIASFLPNNRVVFNIKGNDFRLVVTVRYTQGLMFVRFVGSHAEYDRIDAATI